MPKKKHQEKEQPKKFTEKSHLSPKPSEEETTDEDYTTVVDYETNPKYHKRKIESNWGKYNSEPKYFEYDSEEEDQTPKTDDFSFLIKTASSDCSYFEFNSEKLWKNEENSITNNDIFNLDLNVLSSGLACVPFYKILELNENELTVEDKERMDKAAAKNLSIYKTVKENFLIKNGLIPEVSNVGIVNKNKSTEKTLEQIFEQTVDLNKSNSETSTCSDEIKQLCSDSIEINEGSSTKGGKSVIEQPRKKIFNDNEENLEDWLDSVLDD